MKERLIKYGDIRKRLLSRVDFVGDCWNWRGHIVNNYGSICINRRQYKTHRISYEAFIGEIPEGLTIDHLCRNKICINPDHLEPVTSRENTMRSGIAPATVNSKKTHCYRGHPFSGRNLRTYIRDGMSRRACRACEEINWKAHRMRKKLKEKP